MLSSLAPYIPADVFAVFFFVAYLAFGIPTMIAGPLVPVLWLTAVSYGYGAVVIVLAAIGCVLRLRRSAD